MLIDRLKRFFGRQPAECESSSSEMVSCREALERIQEFVDGELTGMSREEVEAHFEVCTRCYPHLALEHNFRERVKAALEADGMPDDCRERVMSRLRADGCDQVGPRQPPS